MSSAVSYDMLRTKGGRPLCSGSSTWHWSFCSWASGCSALVGPRRAQRLCRDGQLRWSRCAV